MPLFSMAHFIAWLVLAVEMKGALSARKKSARTGRSGQVLLGDKPTAHAKVQAFVQQFCSTKARPNWWFVLSLGIQSRRKHRGAQTVLPLRVKRGNEWETLHLPYAEYPLVLEFFVFGIPGYVDTSYAGGMRLRGHQTFSFGLRPEEVKARLGVEQISAPRQYAPTDFAKMTAKVGYAKAVAVGAVFPSGGRPEVVRSILGEVDEIGRWVGTIAEPRVRTPALLHDVTVHRDEQNGFLFARVQYLTAIGSPIYGVILGKLDEPFVESDYVPQPPHQIARECRWASHAAPFDLLGITG